MAPQLSLANADALERIWIGWRVSIHLLVTLLTAVVLVKDGLSGQLVVFFVSYAAGRWVPVKSAWLAVVIALWAVLLVVSPTASFIAFALFFLVINTLAWTTALPLVATVTAVAVYGIGRHNGWTVGGIIGPIIGAIVACVLGYGFLQLRHESAERVKLSKRAGEAGERARLAGDIHDTVAQGLSSIQMLLHSAERTLEKLHRDLTDPAAKTELDRAREQLALARTTTQENLEETRRIIAALQPAPLVGATLPVALARIVASTPVHTAATFYVDGQPRPLPEDVEAALVRVTQSLVGNVAQHSQATRAAVTLTYEPERVSLDVVDNGIGFAASSPTAANHPYPADQTTAKGSAEGFAGVKHRVEVLGGDMTVESAPGNGCGVSLRIPTPPAEAMTATPILSEPRS